jgi:hypothetical protein
VRAVGCHTDTAILGEDRHAPQQKVVTCQTKQHLCSGCTSPCCCMGCCCQCLVTVEASCRGRRVRQLHVHAAHLNQSASNCLMSSCAHRHTPRVFWQEDPVPLRLLADLLPYHPNHPCLLRWTAAQQPSGATIITSSDVRTSHTVRSTRQCRACSCQPPTTRTSTSPPCAQTTHHRHHPRMCCCAKERRTVCALGLHAPTCLCDGSVTPAWARGVPPLLVLVSHPCMHHTTITLHAGALRGIHPFMGRAAGRQGGQAPTPPRPPGVQRRGTTHRPGCSCEPTYHCSTFPAIA